MWCTHDGDAPRGIGAPHRENAWSRVSTLPESQATLARLTSLVGATSWPESWLQGHRRKADDGPGERLSRGGLVEPRGDVHLQLTLQQAARRLPSVRFRRGTNGIGKRNQLPKPQAIRRVMAQTGNVPARPNHASMTSMVLDAVLNPLFAK